MKAGMTSITELVQKSERIDLSSGLVLLVPDGSIKQGIIMNALSTSRPFANVTIAEILQSPVWKSEHGSLDARRCTVYLVAPGNWNNGHAEYSALICGSGMTIMASLSSCGYETDRNGRWWKVRE